MELSRPVVVQHHGHLTLTVDFQGQILKMLYLRNGRADWHGTKGMWANVESDTWRHVGSLAYNGLTEFVVLLTSCQLSKQYRYFDIKF